MFIAPQNTTDPPPCQIVPKNNVHSSFNTSIASLSLMVMECVKFIGRKVIDELKWRKLGLLKGVSYAHSG